MSIASNRRDNDRELKRRITAVKALDSSIYKSIPTLHFEGKTDFYLVKEFCDDHPSDDLGKIKTVNLAYSRGKMEAIKDHIEALGLGFKISTIVDMDDDFEDLYISTNDSQNIYIKHPNIRSTNPGCVLLTLLLLGEGHLEEAVKNIPLLDNPSNDLVRIILNHATERTSVRFYGVNYEVNPNYKARQENEIENNVPSPMNDHSLCESIYLHKSGIYIEEEKGWRRASLGKKNKARRAINKSLNNSAKELGSKTLENILESMLDDIISLMINEKKTTAYFEDE